MPRYQEEELVENLEYIIVMLCPGLIAAVITSSIDFLRKHFSEKFSITRFVIGQLSDLLFGSCVYLAALEVGIGEPGRIALVIICVSNGREWFKHLIEIKLRGEEAHENKS